MGFRKEVNGLRTWLLGILRWVMVLIFLSFGIQKFTPESAQSMLHYTFPTGPFFVSWLSISRDSEARPICSGAV